MIATLARMKNESYSQKSGFKPISLEHVNQVSSLWNKGCSSEERPFVSTIRKDNVDYLALTSKMKRFRKRAVWRGKMASERRRGIHDRRSRAWLSPLAPHRRADTQSKDSGTQRNLKSARRKSAKFFHELCVCWIAAASVRICRPTLSRRQPVNWRLRRV